MKRRTHNLGMLQLIRKQVKTRYFLYYKSVCIYKEVWPLGTKVTAATLEMYEIYSTAELNKLPKKPRTYLSDSAYTTACIYSVVI